MFMLAQEYSEVEMFKSLFEYLGVGYTRKSKNNVVLEVKSLSGLRDVIFPIFDKHQLKFGKLKAYLIFQKIVNEMLNKNHLKLDGLLRIVYVSQLLNADTARRTEDSFNNLLKYLESKHGKLPTPKDLNIDSWMASITETQLKLPPLALTLDFIAGLIDGDGSFNVGFQFKPYRRVKVNFTVIQESSCKELLNELVSYFSGGKVYDLPSAASRFQIENVDLMLNNVIPILDKAKFNTCKGEKYEIAKKVCEIIKTKGYKSDEALKEIVELSYNSNKSGRSRKITKEEFLKKLQVN
uniref:LAGLIDADG endonuclease n=1 Tax=Juglanconis oblonga TaxID=1940568 RepID=A0A291LIU4_9PEZI|nr:LAGLIDADG endonuclease [Juglanconis oblonga]ATI20351.1 LAGLIDADG endonuclease [Juglanconis oblonga]